MGVCIATLPNRRTPAAHSVTLHMPILHEIGSSSSSDRRSRLLVDDETTGSGSSAPLRGVVLFLEGDQITDEAMVEDLGTLLDPAVHLRVMQDKFGPGFWVGV